MGHPVLRTPASPIDPADIKSPPVQQLIDGFNKSVQQQYDQLTNPALAEYNALLEMQAQRLEAVAGPDQEDADARVAHRRPPEVRTDWSVSSRSGLSDASIAGRSSSVQSAFFITK